MLIALAAVTLQAVATPPVGINHFYVTLDPKTFEAIKQSKWLRDTFSEVQVKTNHSGSASWTGLYIMGAGSYVELFSATGNEGASGIGFFTTPGGADNFNYLFHKGSFGDRTDRSLMYTGSKAQQEPFAHIVTYAGQEKSNLVVWLMEFHEEMYRRNNVAVGAPYADIQTARRTKDKYVYRGLMGDVTGLTVAPTEGPNLLSALQLFGFRENPKAGSWSRGSNGIRVNRPMPVAPRYGIVAAQFTLRSRPKTAHVERFGEHCALTINTDGTAEWRFR